MPRNHERLTLREAAQGGGLSKSALKQAALYGRLKCERVGTQYVTTRRDLTAYLDSRITWRSYGTQFEESDAITEG